MKYDYIVLYSSQTGNTKKLATEIFAMLPGINKELKPVQEARKEQETDVYLVGFWTNMGAPDPATQSFLSGLSGKKIVLFGTCGMGQDQRYYEELTCRARAIVPEDNEILGVFLCQGKMPISVRRKYEEMFADAEQKNMIARMLYNYDQAMLHPNQADFDQARLFVDHILDQLGVAKELENR